MGDRFAGLLRQSYGRLVPFFGRHEVGGVVDGRVRLAHRVLDQLLRPVESGEGDIHGGQDALEQGKPEVEPDCVSGMDATLESLGIMIVAMLACKLTLCGPAEAFTHLTG